MKTFWRFLGGFGYGAVLLLWGFFLTAGGHGTYIPIAFAASPAMGAISLAETDQVFIAAMIASPFFWGILAILIFDRTRHRRATLALVLSHYCLVPFIISGFETTWGYFEKMFEYFPVSLIVGFLLYVAGQIVIWRQVVSKWAGVPLATNGGWWPSKAND